jgi:aminomuconate-semialdehyde/2-hydroxymuconate-6-semialdehyde dehydrogenase
MQDRHRRALRRHGMDNYSGADGGRTRNLSIANAALSQLSYGPEKRRPGLHNRHFRHGSGSTFVFAFYELSSAGQSEDGPARPKPYGKLEGPKSPRETIVIDIPHFIGGRHTNPASGQWLDNVEPATGVVYSRVANGDHHDVESAYEAAQAAFPAWARMPVAERARILTAIAEKIEANLERLARAETIDNGKPIQLARTLEIPRAASNFRFFAGAIVHFHSECYRTDTVALNFTLRQPRGVVGLISPWNLPLYLFTWKVAPALAAGNTAVAKPSELTPMTAHLLTELCQQAGLPAGVLNLVHGHGARAGAAIVAHPGIRTISFTGGSATGAEIARAAAPLFKKLTLELGGKNPNIVFADANLDEAIPSTVRSSFQNQGEICLCGSRIFVERPIYGAFVDRLVDQTKRLKIGDPLEPATDQGALVSAAHLAKVLSYLQLARDEGGAVLCGGSRATLAGRCQRGFFVEPTVVEGLAPTCRFNQEEIFGPVVSATPFDDEEQLLAMANGTRFGLSASLWTRDLGRAHRLAERIEAGTVWVNCWLVRDLRTPFGGTKQSGVGREGGEESLRFFTEPKTVCIKYD